jgi:DNA-binding transcriptional regulator YdaS (Cro superfamily)
MIGHMEALNKAIAIAGTQSSLASALGVVPQVVHNWLVRGNVPADHCPAIERATKGAVRCEDLRPDVDWGYLRGTDCRPEQKAA